MISLQLRRGTRSDLEYIAKRGELLQGEPFFLTDENRFAIATSNNTYVAFIGDIQTFTSSGTWTKPVGCTFVFVRAIGGGGGGAGGASGGSPTVSAMGGGGSGCTEYLYLASLLPNTVSVTIGAGGTGGAAASAGGSGTGTTFGTYLRSGRGLGGDINNTGGTSGSMAVMTTTGAVYMNQLNTMMLSSGSYGQAGTGASSLSRTNSNCARDSYNSAAGGGGGGFSAVNFYGGYGGAGFWITLSTSVDLVDPGNSAVRTTGTPMGNGPAPGAALGNAGSSATRMGDGGAGGNYGTTTGGAGGAGFCGGGGGAGGNGGVTGGAGGAGGNGYCEVYSW